MEQLSTIQKMYFDDIHRTIMDSSPTPPCLSGIESLTVHAESFKITAFNIGTQKHLEFFNETNKGLTYCLASSERIIRYRSTSSRKDPETMYLNSLKDLHNIFCF